jgi:hypothetical protein
MKNYAYIDLLTYIFEKKKTIAMEVYNLSWLRWQAFKFQLKSELPQYAPYTGKRLKWKIKRKRSECKFDITSGIPQEIRFNIDINTNIGYYNWEDNTFHCFDGHIHYLFKRFCKTEKSIDKYVFERMI